jgi:hypothetical protein
MLDRKQVHNSAILRPGFVKYCDIRKRTGSHPFVPVKGKDYEQCVECGTIKRKGPARWL